MEGFCNPKVIFYFSRSGAVGVYFINLGAIETLIRFSRGLGKGKLMCSGFAEGHSAENVKAMFSIKKHELERAARRGGALERTRC